MHPSRNIGFPLVLQGSRCIATFPRYVGGSKGIVIIGHGVARKACFPKGFNGFGVNRVLTRECLFLAKAQKACFSNGLARFSRSAFFLARQIAQGLANPSTLHVIWKWK